MEYSIIGASEFFNLTDCGFTCLYFCLVDLNQSQFIPSLVNHIKSLNCPICEYLLSKNHVCLYNIYTNILPLILNYPFVFVFSFTTVWVNMLIAYWKRKRKPLCHIF